MKDHITWVDHATHDELFKTAMERAALQGALHIPGSVIQEGERRMILASMPVRDLRKSHLDFFDASRTKPLPSSQLAAYDTRNVARALLIELSLKGTIITGTEEAEKEMMSVKR